MIALAICLIDPGQVFSQTDVKSRQPGKNEAVSRSGQIIVRSSDDKQRATMASFAESVSQELGNVLNDNKRPWVHTIEIETRGSLADVGVTGRTMVTRIDLMEGGDLVLLLFVKLSDEFSRQRFSREIVRLLLLERMLRDYKGGGQLDGKRLEVPHWILTGVDGLIEYRRLGRPSDLYAGLVRSRQLLTVEEILKGDPEKLDSLSRASYEASAAALMAALFDQPDGAKSLGDLLSKLILFDGDTALLLKEQFPGLRGGKHSVDKWWALQVASMGELQAMEYLSAEETEQRLRQALRVDFPQNAQEAEGKNKKLGFWKKMNPFGKNNNVVFSSGRIHDFDQFYKHKDYKRVLERSQLSLRALRYRCFPLYVPVVANYEAAVSRLLAGKRRHVTEDLREIDRNRERIAGSMQRVVDYLNYYEATQLQEPGADFEKYHRTRERLRREKPPVRTDRISKYLDAIEKEYSGGLGW